MMSPPFASVPSCPVDPNVGFFRRQGERTQSRAHPERAARLAERSPLVPTRRTPTLNSADQPAPVWTSTKGESTMTDRERLTTAVQALGEDEPEVAVIYLFGSAATGSAHPRSDVDLAVVLMDPEAPSVQDPLLAERLAATLQLALPAHEIDLHLTHRLPLPVRGRVVTTGRPLFVRDDAVRVEFETSTRRLYFDFLPFLERNAREGILSDG
ncbi:MAG: nucleotidyltransferase domain-containing protein [Gemmatimonadales bacterium]|nr:MAG: nucleotidyltransferase domain-containing protein [Gemmatimonadales bacterium]